MRYIYESNLELTLKVLAQFAFVLAILDPMHPMAHPIVKSLALLIKDLANATL